MIATNSIWMMDTAWRYLSGEVRRRDGNIKIDLWHGAEWFEEGEIGYERQVVCQKQFGAKIAGVIDKRMFRRLEVARVLVGAVILGADRKCEGQTFLKRFEYLTGMQEGMNRQMQGHENQQACQSFFQVAEMAHVTVSIRD